MDFYIFLAMLFQGVRMHGFEEPYSWRSTRDRSGRRRADRSSLTESSSEITPVIPIRSFRVQSLPCAASLSISSVKFVSP